MARGEEFFIAVSERDAASHVLGFSASHKVDDDVHGVAVYVRGRAARQGVGSALLRSAETAAIAAGASRLEIDASLAARDFYLAHGFEEIGRGAHLLPSGCSMPCVFMRKDLK
jgi:ribosomal protein S18 acetylase RimI-like enzyme